MPDTATLTHPHLTALLDDLMAVRAEAERLAGLPDTQIAWRPEIGVWSIGDCFEHLRKVDKAYCRKLAEAVPRAEPGADAYRPKWFARKFIGLISPDSMLRLKAPKAIKPQAAAPSGGAESIHRFLEQQAEVAELLRAADGKNINTGTFSSPLAAIIRLSVGEGLTLLVRHEQRHLGQAVRLTERPDFPSA